MAAEAAAYAAGLFDGEGCVYIVPRRIQAASRIRHSYLVALICSNTDRRPLDWLRRRWRGIVAQQVKPGNRTCYSWRLSGSGVIEAFAADVRPYMLIKGDQVDLALEMGAHQRRYGARVGRLGYTEAQQEAQRQLCERLRALKRADPPTLSEEEQVERFLDSPTLLEWEHKVAERGY